MVMEEEILVVNIARYAIRLLVHGGYKEAALHDMVTKICNEEEMRGDEFVNARVHKVES